MNQGVSNGRANGREREKMMYSLIQRSLSKWKDSGGLAKVQREVTFFAQYGP